MKKIMTQKRYLLLGLLGGITLIGLASWYSTLRPPARNNIPKKEKIWQTIEIKSAKDFASIKIPGKVKSNQFAVISPRRSGIIQDLLVDIGDQVYKGQTIGSMLPEGVEGQSSAAIAQARSQLQKARAQLANAKGVAIDAVSVATKQWQESNLQAVTQSTLEIETQKQLTEKKTEALLVATQAWENTKVALFGAGNNNTNRTVIGNFTNTTQQNKVKNKAAEIQQMENSEDWSDPSNIVEHLSHLEIFLAQAEILYKTAKDGRSLTTAQITSNLNIIQSQQIKVSQAKQSLLVLEEKIKKFSSIQAEREAGSERSKEVLGLVESQQNLTTTQAERNVEVALANYNAALVKAGHKSITSPFDGIITARMAEIGQAVSINQPLFYLEGAQTSLSQESLSEIHFNLPESWKSKVSVGTPVTLKTMEGVTLSGEIFRLSQQINLETNSIMATAIAFEENKKITTPINFPHGQSLFVYVTAPDSQIFTVPTLSIKKRSNQYFIWKKDPPQSPFNKGEVITKQIAVEVIAEDGEFSQVFSRELEENDSIVSNPSVTLFTKSE